MDAKAAPQGVVIASEFTTLVRKTGLKPGQTPKPKRPVLCKLAIREDEKSGEIFEVYEFLHIDKAFTNGSSAYRTLALRRDKAQVGNDLLHTLYKQGANLSGPIPSEKLLAAARQTSATAYEVSPERIGWQDGNGQFALHNKVIGTRSDRKTLIPPDWIEDYLAQGARYDGSLDLWKTKVATPARSSSRLMLCICIGFAAPLMKFVNHETFAINLSGPSKLGKTTMLQVVGSMMGLGRRDLIPTFHATAAAIDELFPSFNDLPLPLDEIGNISGEKTKIYQELKAFTYRASTGRGRRRHSSFEKGQRTYRCVIVTAGEKTLDEYADHKRDHGERGRFIDIPVLAAGRSTIFDRPDSDPVPKEAERRLAMVQSWSSGNYLAPVVPFVEWLIQNPEKLAADIDAITKSFVQRYASSVDEHAIRHAARNLGLICAGGILGVRASLLLWKEEDVYEAIGSCFNDSCAQIRAEADRPNILASRLRDDYNGFVVPDLTKHSRKRDAKKLHKTHWARIRAKGTTYVAVNSEWFQKLFPSEIDLRQLLHQLDDEGLIERNINADRDVKSIEWAQTLTTLYHGYPHRHRYIWFHASKFDEWLAR